MEINASKVGKTALKVAGAACIGTGLVVAGAVIASGAAVGSIAESFVVAKKAVTDIFKKEDITENEVVETADAATENDVVVEYQEVVAEEAGEVKPEEKEVVPENVVETVVEETVTEEA